MTETKPKKYKIWSEGFSCTGQSGGASLLGEVEAPTFLGACMKLAVLDKEFAKYYNKERNQYWGCNLFPTRREASKSFG